MRHREHKFPGFISPQSLVLKHPEPPGQTSTTSCVSDIINALMMITSPSTIPTETSVLPGILIPPNVNEHACSSPQQLKSPQLPLSSHNATLLRVSWTTPFFSTHDNHTQLEEGFP